MTTLSQTVANLHPSHLKEIRMMKVKTSQRLHGSYTMSLSRPHRIPETSRKYIHGDPVAMIDWKAFARSDQLIIRERKDEASAYIRICLDLADTMKFDGYDQKVSKLEIAFRVALNLAHIHLETGDLVEIWVMNEGDTYPSRRYRPRSPSDVIGVFEQMKLSSFSGSFQLGRKAKPTDQKVDQVYWIGDLLNPQDRDSFLATGKRSCLVHTLHNDEIDIQWIHHKDCYFDQGVELKEFTGDKLKSEYNKQIKKWLEDQSSYYSKEPCVYQLITSSTSLYDYIQFLDSLPIRMIV